MQKFPAIGLAALAAPLVLFATAAIPQSGTDGAATAPSKALQEQSSSANPDAGSFLETNPLSKYDDMQLAASALQDQALQEKLKVMAPHVLFVPDDSTFSKIEMGGTETAKKSKMATMLSGLLVPNGMNLGSLEMALSADESNKLVMATTQGERLRFIKNGDAILIRDDSNHTVAAIEDVGQIGPVSLVKINGGPMVEARLSAN